MLSYSSLIRYSRYVEIIVVFYLLYRLCTGFFISTIPLVFVKNVNKNKQPSYGPFVN